MMSTETSFLLDDRGYITILFFPGVARSTTTLVEIAPKPSYTNLNPSKSLQSTKTSNSSLMRNIGKRESCYAGKGPEFQKVVFDLHGQSPLVKHFLQNKRLAKDSGTSILVQRTEIDKLPPIN